MGVGKAAAAALNILYWDGNSSRRFSISTTTRQKEAEKVAGKGQGAFVPSIGSMVCECKGRTVLRFHSGQDIFYPGPVE